MEKFILNKTVRTAVSLGLITGLVALSACQPAPEEEKGLSAFNQIEGNVIQNDKKALDGTGKVLLRSSLPGIISSRSVELKGTLPSEGSSIALALYSDSLVLDSAKGVIVEFKRASAVVDDVDVKIFVQGAGVTVQPTRVSYFRGMGLDLVVEVHNTLTSTRVLVWRNNGVTYSLANADVDSATASHFVSAYPTGGGQGTFAGVILNKARVTTALFDEAKVPRP